jgi:class 3 adenylate cyclase
MHEHDATILFGDLRGFSGIAASYPGEVVFDLLNGCFIALSEIAARHGGTIDKFIGDSIMMVFSRPAGGGRQSAAASCIARWTCKSLWTGATGRCATPTAPSFKAPISNR